MTKNTTASIARKILADHAARLTDADLCRVGLDPVDGQTLLRAIGVRGQQADKRQITVMFCDLVGSTAMSQRLDPEELRDIMQTYRSTCADVVKRYDGKEIGRAHV